MRRRLCALHWVHNRRFLSLTGRLYGEVMQDTSIDTRRRKLNFRAWRRGFREMDLLMGSFADEYLEAYQAEELDEFEALLGVPDWEVYAWLIGQTPVPNNHRGPVLDQLIAFRYAAQGG